MENLDYNLRPLWDALLEIYIKYAEICQKHSLTFYVTGGTAIGALRHKGFIPWDDDFDVIMPRPDYIKFMEVYSQELPNHYRAMDFRNTSNYPYDFGKVYDMRKDVVKHVSDESNLLLSQGIFIDVIPIDGMPKATIPFYIWQISRMAWRRAGQIKKEKLVMRPFWWLMSKLLRIPNQSDKDRRMAFEKWLSKYDFYNSPAAEDFNASPRRRLARAFTPATYGTPKMVPFEYIEVPVVQDTDFFMNVIFGNWRELPPEEKRVPEHQNGND